MLILTVYCRLEDYPETLVLPGTAGSATLDGTAVEHLVAIPGRARAAVSR